MAGIGFELKKLFHRRGLMAMLRAYGYAGVICAGPMLLGVLLQFGVLIVSSWWQVGRPDRDLLVCMITYTLLASLVLTMITYNVDGVKMPKIKKRDTSAWIRKVADRKSVV